MGSKHCFRKRTRAKTTRTTQSIFTKHRNILVIKSGKLFSYRMHLRSGQFPKIEVYNISPNSNQKHNEVRQQWLNNIRRYGTLPKDVSFFICSVHFEKSCYERDLQVRVHT